MLKKNLISSLFLNARHKKTFDILSDLAPTKILDVGCDDGHFLAILKKHLNSELYGCDMDNTNLDEAIKNCPTATIIHGDVINLKSGLFDLVTMLEVLEHQKDHKRLLINARSILRKDGRLLISIPRSELLHWRLIWWLWSNTLGRRWHGQHNDLTENHLVYDASKCGFKLEKKSRFFFGCISIMLFKRG